MNNQNVLTILIPATRIAYFEAALNSALAQSIPNIAIVVGDNTPDQQIIRAFSDKYRHRNINWLNSHRYTGGAQDLHGEFLIDHVKTEYVRFLFDDDLIYPVSSQHLLTQLANPSVAFAFHGRHVIDKSANIIESKTWIPDSQIVYIERAQAISLIFRTCSNLFMEPSFSMYRTKDAKKINSAGIEILGFPLKFLGDIATSLEATKIGRLCGSSQLLGAFQIHEANQSGLSSPLRIAGVYEWELIARSLAAEFEPTANEFHLCVKRINELYEINKSYAKPLQDFQNLLQQSINEGAFVSEKEFRNLLLATGLYN